MNSKGRCYQKTEKILKRAKVAVGLSGGVDSSVSAALLVEAGYEVTGVFLECFRAPGCRVDEDRKDAMDVALKLGIPFKVLDFKKEYKERVVDYFYSEYKAGRTPNPDVMCNREIKFGMFYRWAIEEEGFDFVATGHYARVQCTREERRTKNEEQCELLRGVEERKDQSYFLYQLGEEKLKHILFPIGGMTKEQVRDEAKKRGLSVADKPDSQGICFIGEVDIKSFLESLGMKEKEGDVVDQDGKVIGVHKGAWFYTVGQRHGFKIEVKSPESKPVYVVEKDVGRNLLVVGMREELLREEVCVGEVHWISSSYKLQVTSDKVLVRIRHGGALVCARCKMQDNRCKIRLEEPVFGVAEGQAVVFYEGEVVLGGGVIDG